MRTLRERSLSHGTQGVAELAVRCREFSHKLEGPNDLDPLLKRIGNARYVLLGEASHGTSEYYIWRAWLSQRLIQEKGFSFIAVEGDWPDCYQVNRYVKGYPDSGERARDVLHAFERWPTWMWANWEIVALAEWLRKYNANLPDEKKVGFYGLDVYSLWDSLEAVIRYLERVDSKAAEAARKAYHCFEPYAEDMQEYARATYHFVPASCQEEAVALLAEMRREMPALAPEEREARFVAEQNALVVKNAETYYRTMIRGDRTSWNVRDNHMVETLERLMRFHGPDAKGIVWEHNTHIGDARATDMARGGMVNVGQLVREAHHKDEVVLIGFSSYEGGVIASYEWGAPMQRMRVPAGRPGSWEDVLHQASAQDKLLLLTDGTLNADIQMGGFLEPRGHRAIGVVYDPDYEAFGNYVPTVLPLRYDALLYIDRTHALHPLHMEPYLGGEPPETYPWNV
ncbi:MAG TPA: erythromycin esterase family protein [Chthonomonadaceae bacterium]|nr:erythromycin esterase family protein [Chthonomonadaceae bacterium]